MAKTNKSYVKEVFLPEVLDEFDREDENNIIQIASEMGYFDYPKTIFELIEEHKVLINGEYSNFSLWGWTNICPAHSLYNYLFLIIFTFLMHTKGK